MSTDNTMHADIDEAFAPLSGVNFANDNANDSGGKGEAGMIVRPVPANAPSPMRRHPSHGDAARIYEYRDAGGLQHLACRFERTDGDGTISKVVLPQSLWRLPDDKLEWRWKAPTNSRSLYNADMIAAKLGADILFVEGEKAADAAARLFPDMVATTTMGGCNAPHLSDLAPLAGRRVVIGYDNDDAGAKYRDAVAKLAWDAGAAEVYVMHPDRLGRFRVEGDQVVGRGAEAKRGWDLADAEADGWTAELVAMEAAKGDLFEPLAKPAVNDNVAVTEMPEGYRLDAKGVQKAVVDREGNLKWHKVCSHLLVVGRARNPDGKGWSLVVELRDADGTMHEIVIPMTDMAGDGTAVIQRLVDSGLMMPAGGRAKAAVLEYLTQCDPDQRVLLVDNCGHHGNVYVLPDRTYGDSGGERVVLQAPPADNPFQKKGSLEQWQGFAELAVGNSRLILALSAAFAGPLLPLVNAEGGGFHFRGGSSLGKTTSLYLAGSVWGGGPNGFLNTWRLTDNFAEGIATARNHNVLMLDEMGQVDGKSLAATAYMLANGEGKGRAGRGGDARATKRWKLIFLSTGEIGLSDKIAEHGGRVMAGQQVRVVDIPADAGTGHGIFDTLHGFPDGAALSRHIVAESKRVYGVAADSFLPLLMADRDGAVEAVALCRDEFVARYCPQDADGQVHRVYHRFGLAAAAGELAAAMGVLPWEQGEAIRGVARCAADWLASRGGTEASEVQEGVRQVLDFLQLHGGTRFDEWYDGSLGGGERTTEKARDRVGWRRMVGTGDDGKWEYFATAAGFKEICIGFDQQMVAKALIARKVLTPDGQGKSAKAFTVPGHGKVRLYHLVPREDGDA